MLSPDQIKQIERLVKKVGNFQQQEQAKILTSDIDEKSLNQLVSYVDIESEKMLTNGLNQITPSAGYLTEEGTINLVNDTQYWIIDPLDGTTNYLFQHRQYSISIALVMNSTTVFGCVYIPTDDEMFIGTKNGAFLNNSKISVSNRYTLEQTLIATGFPYYTFEELDSYLSVIKVLMKKTKGLRRMGSAAIDLAYTACGKFDGFFELNLSPWDVAAGAYIVQQAGGSVSDFNSEDNFIFGKSIVCGNKEIHARLIDEIKKYTF